MQETYYTVQGQIYTIKGSFFMIRHIVFFSAKDQKDLSVIKEGLQILKDIPGSRNFEVCYNSKRDALSKETDVVVYCEFDDVKALLTRTKSTPLYQESIGRVRPLRDLRIAADFESTVVVCPA